MYFHQLGVKTSVFAIFVLKPHYQPVLHTPLEIDNNIINNSPQDVVSGNSKLNMAFVANLFNSYPGLPPMDAEEVDLEEAREETREEKSELTNLKLQTLALLMNRASDRVRQKMGNSATFSREIMRQERSIMRQIMRFFKS